MEPTRFVPPSRRSAGVRLIQSLDNHLPILFLIPGFVCLFLVIGYPLGYNIWASFTDMNLMYPGYGYVGFENYALTLGDPNILGAVGRTLSFTLFSVFGQLLVGLVAALALDKIVVGRTALRLMLIVPWAFPAIVLAYGWRFMLDPIYGVTNDLLMKVGLIDAPVAWLADTTWAMPSMILINIWFGFPFMMVSVMAALTTIPRELYEASDVDGATFWQQTRHITLPLLMPILGSLVILRTIWVFNNFDFIFLTTGGGPVNATTTLPLYAFQVGWQRFDIGRMAAVSVLMILLLSSILALYIRMLRGSRAGD